MIGRLKGLVEETGDDWALIDVGGVCYVVFCSGRTLSALPARGQATVLEIETHVREDHFHLYGFATPSERDWFKLLTSVQGVGAKVGLAILTVQGPEQLLQAIAAGDKAAVAQASGVGPKLAGRVVSELKDKVGGMVLGSAAQTSATAGGGASASGPADEAISALVNLGYGRSEAFGAVGRVLQDSDGKADLDTLIRLGLRELAS
ncbi:MAG: Holliday junction branch migration protein RuvA [Alphaproteobacteria bacterium]